MQDLFKTGSFSSVLKPIVYLARFFGVFPVSNLGSLDTNLWKIRLWSWTYLYSIVINFTLMFLSTDCTFGSIIQILGQSGGGGATDVLTYSSFLILLIFPKYILSIVFLAKTKYLVSFITSIINYDLKYQLKNTTRAWSIKLIIIFITGIFGGIGSFDLTKETLQRISLDQSAKCVVLSSIFQTQISLFSHIVHPLLEISVNTYLVVIVVICTSGIEQRIHAIKHDFNRKIIKVKKPFASTLDFEYGIQKSRERTQFALQSMNGQKSKIVSDNYGDYLEENDSMSSFLERFIDVIDMKAKLLNCFSLLILIFVSTGILVIILFIYLVLISIKDSATELSTFQLIMSLFPLISMGSVAVVRMSVLCEVGDDLEYSISALAEELNYVDITNLPAPLAKKILYFQSIVGKVDIMLTGAGYFDLNRKFLASMVGPIITFVVVLAQFRLTDSPTSPLKPQSNTPDNT